MIHTTTPVERRKRVTTSAVLTGVLLAGAAGTALAAELDSVRLRIGSPEESGDIEGGGLALTFTPDTSPAWLTWIGEDLHVEAAVSFWSDAGPDGDVYTAHLGPIWHFRPQWLGSRGFIEAGTSDSRERDVTNPCPTVSRRKQVLLAAD